MRLGWKKDSIEILKVKMGIFQEYGRSSIGYNEKGAVIGISDC